jgi:hypothetical protein
MSIVIDIVIIETLMSAMPVNLVRLIGELIY